MELFSQIKRVFRPPSEVFQDPVFGRLRREGRGCWCGVVPFPHAETDLTTLGLIIDAGLERPSDAQRAFFQELQCRYPALWPELTAALAARHRELKTPEELREHLSDAALHLPPLPEEEPRVWALAYTFDTDLDRHCRYYVELQEWELLHVSVGS